MGAFNRGEQAMWTAQDHFHFRCIIYRGMKMLLEFDHKKATQVANYLTKKEGDQIDKLKLIKLIYLEEAERKYAATYLGLGGIENTIVSRADVDADVFSKSELEALDFAYNKFGDNSASNLVDVTHRYPEWNKFKLALESKGTTRESMSYSDFFKNPSGITDDQFTLSADILCASQELFEEDYKVAEYWR